jgi:hypothetical protein
MWLVIPQDDGGAKIGECTEKVGACRGTCPDCDAMKRMAGWKPDIKPDKPKAKKAGEGNG